MRRAVAIAIALVSCSDARDDDPFGGSSPASGTLGATQDGSGDAAGTISGEAGDSGDDNGPGSGPKLDVGPQDTEGPDSADDEGGDNEGCEKVDFLFVIDGSGSMGDNKDSLIASFPGFIASIQNTLDDAQDYHIMVVDTDAQWGGDCAAICPLFFNQCPDVPDYPCETGPPSACETTLGAGITYTMAEDAPSVPCEFSTGLRYMDTTEPDLTASFQCAAKVGSDGDSDERPMSAMVSALSPELTAMGACNEGFVREDAILVITIITDEEDVNSTGFPDGWFANIIASKAGDETAIVVLGLVNDTDAAMPVCPAESQDPVNVRTFIDMFPNSIRGSVCEPSYNAFFQEAVDLIDTTCDAFEPPEG
jgi:hypothetical protein